MPNIPPDPPVPETVFPSIRLPVMFAVEGFVILRQKKLLLPVLPDLLLFVIVLLVMFSVVGDPPSISVIAPVPGITLLLIVLPEMFTMLSDAAFWIPVNVPEVAVA